MTARDGALHLPDIGLSVRASASETAGAFTLMESAGMAPGDGPPRHIHSREDEAFYVLEGTYVWERGDERIEAVPGSFIWLPRNIPHRFVVGPGGGRMLHFFVPGGIDRYFVEWQAALRADATGADITRIAARYGLSYAEDPWR